MEEGENLCFDIKFFDPDTPADSLTLNVNGQIFDSSFTSPPATVGGYFDTLYSDPLNGVDTVGTTFCWSTVCGQAQTLPYVLSASVSDRGCPPKTTSVVYEVTVNKTVSLIEFMPFMLIINLLFIFLLKLLNKKREDRAFSFYIYPITIDGLTDNCSVNCEKLYF